MYRNLSRCLVAAALFALPTLAQLPLLPNGVQSTGPLRNNYTGYVGMEFSLGLSLQISSLGRAYFAGNAGTHTIKLVNAGTGVDVPGGSVQLTMSASGTTPFQYAALTTPVLLSANTNYLLVSQEVAGGDKWQDLQNITPAGGYNFFNIGGGVYTDASSAYVVVPNTTGGAYVPPNLLYLPPGSGQTTVAITSPTANQVVTPPYTYQFSATVAGADSQVGGSTLQFQLDGENFYAPQSYISSTVFSISIDPTLIVAGTHTLTAIFTTPGVSPVTSTPVTFTIPSYPGNYGGTYPIGTQNLVTAETPGPLRSNFTGFVGMSFTTGNDPLRVRSLGRFVAPGDAQSHLVKLVDASSGIDVPGAAATVVLNASSAPAGQFAYTYLLPNNSVILAAKHTYYLLSQETAGGDPWYDIGTVATSSLAVNGPVYQPPGAGYQFVPNAGYSYVPVSLEYSDTLAEVPPLVTLTSPGNGSTVSGNVNVQAAAVTYQGVTPVPTIVNYQFQLSGVINPPVVVGSSSNGAITLNTAAYPSGAAYLQVTATDSEGGMGYGFFQLNFQNTVVVPYGTAFVTSVNPTFLRNNFSSYVGMEFTVGATALQVSSLGRYCSAGNAQSHNIKLVQASGADVAGGGATVNMSGCTTGQFVYATLVAPVTLAAGVSYYLVDLEANGGDEWYDFSPIGTTTAASVVGPVYEGSAGTLVTVGLPSSSFVPLNFVYSTGGTFSGSLTTSVTSVTAQGVTATASSNSPVTSVQIQVDGYSLTPPLTSAPYVQPIPTLNYGTHAFTSIAKDAVGDVATSAPFSLTTDFHDPSNQGEFQLHSLITTGGGPLRNNYTGWVGFQFTLSSAPVFPGTDILPSTPNFMGRYCLTGNTMPHFVKIVRASDSTDVASAWINCANVTLQDGVPATFAAINGTLVPGTTYYLVSQEVFGGDQFSDIGSAVPFIGTFGGGNTGNTPYYSNFSIDGPVYFDGVKYVLVPLPNYSYATVYLLALTSAI